MSIQNWKLNREIHLFLTSGSWQCCPALELKENLSSSEGETFPVGGATAVWRVTSCKALLCPLLDQFPACWSLLPLLCAIRRDHDHGNLSLFYAGSEPRWSKSHIQASKRTQMQMAFTKLLGFDSFAAVKEVQAHLSSCGLSSLGWGDSIPCTSRTFLFCC